MSKNQTKVYSFDVYDTLLTRIFYKPDDVFYQLAKNFYKKINKNVTENDLIEFVKKRKSAQNNAWKQSNGKEINFNDIYDNFEIEEYHKKYLKEEEIKIEKKSIVPIKINVDKLKQLQSDGKRVICVSDMYFSQDIIYSMLQNIGVNLDKEDIYVSSTVGFSKAKGKLFKHILKVEKIKPADLFHIGDNPRGDYVVPRIFGIKSKLFRRLLYLKSESYCSSFEQRTIVGIRRAVRLSFGQGEENTIYSSVIVPAFTSFLFWVLDSASKNGIKRLFFVARDSHIFYKSSQLVSKLYPELDFRYLFGSRQAWLFPSLHTLSVSELKKKFMVDGHDITINSFLKMLHSDIEDFRNNLEQYNLTNYNTELNQSDYKKLWEFISDVEVQKKLYDRLQEIKDNTFQYLKQEGVTTEDNALVDIGWSLNTQKSLSDLIRSYNKNYKIKGFYFASKKNVADGIVESDYFSLSKLSGKNKHFPNFNLVMENAKFIDQVLLSADHGRTISYTKNNDKYIPVFEKASFNENNFALLSHKMMEQYVKHLLEFDLIDRFKEYDIFSSNIKVFSKFIVNPSLYELKPFLAYKIAEDQNETIKYNLIRKIPLLDILKFLYKNVFLKKRKGYYSLKSSWIFGSVRISSIFVRIIFFFYKMLNK